MFHRKSWSLLFQEVPYQLLLWVRESYLWGSVFHRKSGSLLFQEVPHQLLLWVRESYLRGSSSVFHNKSYFLLFQEVPHQLLQWVRENLTSEVLCSKGSLGLFSSRRSLINCFCGSESLTSEVLCSTGSLGLFSSRRSLISCFCGSENLTSEVLVLCFTGSLGLFSSRRSLINCFSESERILRQRFCVPQEVLVSSPPGDPSSPASVGHRILPQKFYVPQEVLVSSLPGGLSSAASVSQRILPQRFYVRQEVWVSSLPADPSSALPPSVSVSRWTRCVSRFAASDADPPTPAAPSTSTATGIMKKLTSVYFGLQQTVVFSWHNDFKWQQQKLPQRLGSKHLAVPQVPEFISQHEGYFRLSLTFILILSFCKWNYW